MVGTALVRLLPPASRQASLSISCGEKHLQIEFDLGDSAQFAMVHWDHLDLGIASVICSLLKEGDTFVDVGANWGYFTCVASQVVGASGLVLAVEPNPHAYRQLLKVVRRHGLVNALCINQAALDRVGEEISLVRPFFRQTTSSYVQRKPAGRIPDAVACTVDYLLGKVKRERITVLKVDTEGADLLVLKGARALLRDVKPWVVAEVTPLASRYGYAIGALYEYMTELGYVPFAISNDPSAPRLSGPLTEPIAGELLFQPRESVAS